ncbi:pre-mRNA-processing factor 17-like isoform X2 [Xenia sp. Carnegie-2017]|uniref:pre-mRNA-processing factor 17-like isoform X2 n=1 Tax=Xenia sp. Carnegie-2017 TaxID=2897299 RepID=UPI001F0414F4|nr:pre-mRNA-processing factor 17-like isoform X2 [Xenia sp. Carnegie-2017]
MLRKELIRHIDPSMKDVTFNAKYDELFSASIGPQNPFKTKQQRAHKNMLSGYVEPAHISKFQFDNQLKTFSSYDLLGMLRKQRIARD